MGADLREKAKQLIPVWEKSGFNGVRLECELEGSDEGEPDEQTPEQVAEFNANYVIFQARPCFEDEFIPEPKSKYIEIVRHDLRFRDDFKAELVKQFGGDVTVTHYSGCFEWEVVRIGSKWSPVQS